MKNILVATYIFASIVLAVNTFSNDSTNQVKHTPEFKFTDGIFLDFEQVKKNRPVSKAQILTSVDYTDNTFFEQILKNKTFSFYDHFGQKFDYPVKSIWGYSDNGVLYKNLSNEYFRITIIGSICHFVAYVTTYDYPPSAYYNPYDRYNSYNYRAGNRTENTNLKQYIIDFNTGKVLEYTTSNLEAIFVKDHEIYDEYSSLSKKKKNKLKFLYIRKFNERNPIYFPKNKLIP